ncbi:uncharacterized protein LOC107788341 [Nicotiana tabacum]|uniref:Uncharacterized protein LOC107788341 n=1 Tax=Nicotiana tabacum TaxID=4097 RepID=A0A1S3ZMI9_TOBAC|nr:PREDICTED: uncharacterized protein LOC107788341 [Nicotiana tabacum]
MRDKLGGDDEPYYDSSDPDSFESESDLEGEGDPVSDDDVDGEDNMGQLRGRKKTNRVVYDPSTKIVTWQLGMVFENVKEFREAVTKYAIKKGIQLVKDPNEPYRVRVKFKTGCPWLLFASKEGRSTNFTIKTYNPRHKCHKTTYNYLCNSKYVAKQFKDRITSQPRIKGWKIQDMVRKKLGLYVGKTVCLKAKKLVLKEIMGDHVAEFGRILDYRDMLLKTNHGSTCAVKLTDTDDGQKQLSSFYICFAAMKQGFMEGCRRCIGLDGYFLKGVCKGQLLAAVAKDENNQMFPIAWAVVGTEKKQTWSWFLKLLQTDLNLGDGRELTMISLCSAVEEILPEREHRMCSRHILANWAIKWRGIERRKRFWSVVRSIFESEMKIKLDDLDKLGHNIYEDLVKYNKARWCKAFFQTFSKCDSVDNNMCESFNAWILGPRHKTIISMLEEIRVKVMSRIAKMRDFAETWQDGVSPMTMMVFNTNVERSMRVDFMFNGDTGFELKDGPCKFIVDLRTGYCSCMSWEMKGTPCPHAITTMHFKRLDPSENIIHWYMKETYMKAYSHFIQPVPNMKMSPESSNPKHSLPTARKVYTGPLIDSTHVTGDIGYKPSKGLKWKGKEAVTQRQLQV